MRRWLPPTLRLLAAGAVGLTIAGCSGSDGPSDHGTRYDGSYTSLTLSAAPSGAPGAVSSSAAAPSVADYSDPEAVIEALAQNGVDCSSAVKIQVGDRDRSYLDQASTCVIDGEKVAVASFSQAEQRAEYLRIGQTGSGAYPHFAIGTNWAVATLTSATAQAIADAIGGRVY
jgi:hypothetical protein